MDAFVDDLKEGAKQLADGDFSELPELSTQSLPELVQHPVVLLCLTALIGFLVLAGEGLSICFLLATHGAAVFSEPLRIPARAKEGANGE